MLTGSRDPVIIVKTLRDNWSSSLTHQRPLSMSRAYAELVKLLDGLRPDPAPFWGKLKFYADLLRPHFSLPRVLNFYPRNSVPTGPQNKGYNEDPYQRTFYTPHAGQSVAPGASGYGAFNPNTGFFQAVAVSTGNPVAVMVGPPSPSTPPPPSIPDHHAGTRRLSIQRLLVRQSRIRTLASVRR